MPQNKTDLNGIIMVYPYIKPYYRDIPYIEVTVPKPEIDLNGSITVRRELNTDLDISVTFPDPEIDLKGQVTVRYWSDTDFSINVRVPTDVKPIPPVQIQGDYIIEIPFPYKQFTDTEFFLTQVKYPSGQQPPPNNNFLTIFSSPLMTGVDNLFIPQRLYSRYDEHHLVFSNSLGLKVGDEIRFTFCHNDGKYHVKKVEFSFDAQGNASYYFLDPRIPYKRNIKNIDIKLLVFVNRKQVLLNIDYVIDTEKGILTFINDKLANKPGDKIDILCFFTGIDDTAIADLPMSGYIYLKRNMIDRNYNNNLMATFINGKLIPRDKILHISNNIYKIKEDIKSRHDLQILNMSNRIDCIVPFYKQHTQNPPFDKYAFNPESLNILDEQQIRYMEYCFPISVTTYRYVNCRQNIYLYHNPVYFSPSFLLENKDKWISFVHLKVKREDLKYTLTFYANDIDMVPTKNMQVKVELHIKTPFEERLEESRTTILLCTLPSKVTQIDEDYCYCSLEIKQIINLDIWNNRFIESCDGITFRIEPDRTYQDTPCKVYFTLDTNKFEDYETEQISIFEYRISDKYDGLGNISYRKELAFNPEEYTKEVIRKDEDIRT